MSPNCKLKLRVKKGSLAGLAVERLDVLPPSARKGCGLNTSRASLSKVCRPAGAVDRYRTAGPDRPTLTDFPPEDRHAQRDPATHERFEYARARTG